MVQSGKCHGSNESRKLSSMRIEVRPTASGLGVGVRGWPWPLTLTFNPRRAMVMTRTLARGQGQKSLGWKVIVDTDGRTDAWTEAIALPPMLLLQPFYAPWTLSRTNWVVGSRKVKPGWYNQSGFTGARDSEWHMQICIFLRQVITPTSHHSVFHRRMPFLPPNQQRQSTEGT